MRNCFSCEERHILRRMQINKLINEIMNIEIVTNFKSVELGNT